ncbi:MAG: ankyrin repeat domain-containing protein [Aquabacterium sp.]
MRRRFIGVGIAALVLMSQHGHAQVALDLKLSKKGEETADALAQCIVYYSSLSFDKKPAETSKYQAAWGSIESNLNHMMSAQSPRGSKYARLDAAVNALFGIDPAKLTNKQVADALSKVAKDTKAMTKLSNRMAARCEELAGDQVHLDRSMYQMPEGVRQAIEENEARQEARRKEDEHYAEAGQQLTQLLKANDLRGFTLALHGESTSVRQQLLKQAPCMAAESATVDSARAVYRMAKSEITDKADAALCRITDAAIQAGRADILLMAIEEGETTSEKQLKDLVSRLNPNMTAVPSEAKLRLFNVLADVPGSENYDWSRLLRVYVDDPALPWALLKKRGGLKAIDDHGVAALREMVHQASGANRELLLQQIDKLIFAGVDVNKAKHGDEPPILAAGCDAGVVGLLLKGHANPNVTDAFGYETPLHRVLACKTSAEKVALMSLLINAGADVNFKRSDRPNARRTVLAELCERGAEPEVSEILVGAGAKVDVIDQYGQTALMDLYMKTPQSVERLIACGASVNARDKNGQTALDHLAAAGAFDAVTALCKHGATPRSHCEGAGHSSAMAKPEGICFRAEYSPGMPVPNRHYVAELTDGRIVEGRTDADGRTLLCGEKVINGAKFNVIYDSEGAGFY